MKLITEYLAEANKFDRLADDETKNEELKASLKKQAEAYRKLAIERAKKLGIPPSDTS
jgi:hypothetical protein